MIITHYTLEYTALALTELDEQRRAVFQGPLRQYVISTTQDQRTRTIRFHMSQESFLEVVKRWPWLLCSNLGEHLPLGDFWGSPRDYVAYSPFVPTFTRGVWPWEY